MAGLLHYPRIALYRLRPVNYLPYRPLDLSNVKSICVGTKSRKIGDSLVLSTLPRRLKEKYPHLSVRIFPKAYNPIVFHNNPYVDGVRYLPSKVYGDDCEWGNGQIIQLKEEYFNLPQTSPPKAELYLTEAEKNWVLEHRKKSTRPICAFHPIAAPYATPIKLDFWSKLVSRWKDKVDFWQLGFEGQQVLPGVHQAFLFNSKKSEARKMFATLSTVDFFMGLDSGPMHVARSFERPSAVFTINTEYERAFDLRKTTPYFFFNSPWDIFLYEENTHICVAKKSDTAIAEAADQFIESRLSR